MIKRVKRIVKNKISFIRSRFQKKEDSVNEHDEFYKKQDAVDYHRKFFADFEKRDFINKDELGLDPFLKRVEGLGDCAVDIGSGAGYFSIKLADRFKLVYGIEPSSKAAEVFKSLYGDDERFNRVNLITDFAEDGIKKLNFDKPVFWFTSTVLSHITDRAVEDILTLVNQKSPAGSAFVFGEVWGDDYQGHMWHVRSKDWWQKRLPGWVLFFEDFVVDKEQYIYKGIKGIKK